MSKYTHFTKLKHLIFLNRGSTACVRERGFHQGCDTFVLLEGSETQRGRVSRTRACENLEAIDEGKAAPEEECPNTVSCSDILVFAARDASYILSKYMILSLFLNIRYFCFVKQMYLHIF
jgi:hypothetical protein